MRPDHDPWRGLREGCGCLAALLLAVGVFGWELYEWLT